MAAGDEPLGPQPLLVKDPGLPVARAVEVNPRIRPGSPLAVVGLFVEVIRARFQPSVVGTTLPWVWDADIKETKIAIESAYVEDQAHRDFCPSVFVSVPEASYGRTVIGDKAGQNLASGCTGFFALDTQQIAIECKGAKRGEAYTIGDIVRVFLQASSDEIQATFGLHEMTPLTLGQPQPRKADKDVWVAPITFTVQIPARWSTKPTGPLLRQVVARITASGADDATDYFTAVALREG